MDMSDKDLFTKEEALEFLTNNLEIKDVQLRFVNDRHNLLDEIVTKIQTNLPFQNLRLLQEEPGKRHIPSLDEIKQDVLSGVGGLCYNLNVAGYFLLKAIGFKAYLALATCTSSVVSTNNHVIVYVENVNTDGDKFLVEFAVGFPTFQAINLNFENESQHYVDSFIEYKYMKYQNKILRMHRAGDLIKVQNQESVSSFDGLTFVVDGWRRFYYTEDGGRNSLEDLCPCFEKVFTDPKASPFHLSFRVIGFPGKKAVMVINERTLIENDKGELVATPIDGGDEGIVRTVRHLFPALPEDLIGQALASWRQAL